MQPISSHISKLPNVAGDAKQRQAVAGFETHLAKQQSLMGHKVSGVLDEATEKKLRGLSDEFVSFAFYQPMFEQMRNSPFKSDMFHGGMGEDMFRRQMDEIMSQRMAASSKNPIADAIYKHISNGMVKKYEAVDVVHEK